MVAVWILNLKGGVGKTSTLLPRRPARWPAPAVACAARRCGPPSLAHPGFLRTADDAASPRGFNDRLAVDPDQVAVPESLVRHTGSVASTRSRARAISPG